MKHTPTPWKILPKSDGVQRFVEIGADEQDFIADVCVENAEANARHIVKCVNYIGEHDPDELPPLKELLKGEK